MLSVNEAALELAMGRCLQAGGKYLANTIEMMLPNNKKNFTAVLCNFLMKCLIASPCTRLEDAVIDFLYYTTLNMNMVQQSTQRVEK